MPAHSVTTIQCVSGLRTGLGNSSSHHALTVRSSTILFLLWAVGGVFALVVMQARDCSQVLNIYQQMIRQHVRPDRTTFQLMVLVCKHGLPADPDLAIELFEEMRRSDFVQTQPTVPMYVRTRRCFCCLRRLCLGRMVAALSWGV